MVIGFKDAVKLTGISIISCCAVFVCNLFLSYNIDMAGIKAGIVARPAIAFYNAQISLARVISVISGGCLLFTSVIMLFFYIKHYIDIHGKELGILKALGYSRLTIAGGFWVFGFSVLTGTAAGFCLSFLLMPSFYNTMNADGILPDLAVHFHLSLALCLIVLPTALFAVLAVFYSHRKLKRPALELLKGNVSTPKIHRSKSTQGLPFLRELKRSTAGSRKSLIFFIAFSSYCYAAMMQMSFSMDKLGGSTMFVVILIVIGIILSGTTLFLSVTTVVNANTKTISILRVFGYSHKACCRAILGGYRPISYIGFVIGTFYQYALMKFVINMFFQDITGVIEFNFNLKSFIIVLASFLLLYEIIMFGYSERIKKLSIKEVMLE